MATTLFDSGIEQVDIQEEIQRSYLDYAMSVIVGRALPDVRDGLKPVHRRVLYGMNEMGLQPNRRYVKCAKVTGEVMGNYHPHGDSAIYDTLVRMGQPFTLRSPLIAKKGNFGSVDGDEPAAMRYCLTGDALVRLADGSSIPIAEIAPGAAPDSNTDIDLKLSGRSGTPVRATRLFHSGVHPTLRMTTREGYRLEGTPNHPVLCLVPVAGVPVLRGSSSTRFTPAIVWRWCVGRQKSWGSSQRARRTSRSWRGPSCPKAGCRPHGLGSTTSTRNSSAGS